ARQLRAVLRHRVRQRGQLHQAAADEHRQSRSAESDARVSPPDASAAAAHDERTVTQSRWALLGGNFAIGCGVMAPSGVMNDLVDSLHVSAAVAGQLITIGAVVLALGAPLLAARVADSDRRRLLALW